MLVAVAPSTDAATLAWRAVLSGLLVIACATDLRTRRIPNALVLVVLATALLRATLLVLRHAGESSPAGFASGLGDAALGALCGLVLWLPLYAFGAFGAGDVKLFAAAAAWLGAGSVPSATLNTALAGGVLGLAWFGARYVGRLAPMLAPVLARRAVTRLQLTGAEPFRVPYGVAIAAGVLATVWSAP